MFNLLNKRPKIGLALSGGGPTGLAHIGVIKSLLKHNIPIDFIAGTSVGSIAAVFYAAKKDASAMEEYILKKNWWQMLEGVLQGMRIQSFIEGYLGKEVQFSDLKIPCKTVAVDLKNGDIIEIDKGPVINGMLASTAAPMILKPVLLDGRYLVDGGLTSPVPVSTVRKMGADIVIAVNLYQTCLIDDIKDEMNLLSVAQHTINIMLRNIASYEEKRADLIIAPNICDIHWKTLLNEKGKKDGINQGEKSMDEAIISLNILIKSKQPIFPKLLGKLKKMFT